MRTQKLALTLIAVCALMTTGICWIGAQPPPDKPAPPASEGQPRQGMRPGRNAASRMLREAQKLTLTDDQKTKLEDISKKMGEDMAKLRPHPQAGATSGTVAAPPPAPPSEEPRKAMEEMNKKYTVEIQSVLTPEQKTQIEAKMKEAPTGGGRDRGPRQGGEAPPPPKP